MATPLSAYPGVLDALAPRLAPGAVVSDVGSAKASVAALAAKLPDPSRFIPGHPMAGTEQSGPEAGLADLFRGRYWLFTPGPEADPAALALMQRMVRAFGARPVLLEAQEHDRMLAFISHLPHAAAYALVASVQEAAARGEAAEGAAARYAAGGLRDFTRIAASDPVMWRDVFLANKGPLLAALESYRAALDSLAEAVEREDAAFLEDVFSRTRALRREIERVHQAGFFDAREAEAVVGTRSEKGARAGKSAAAGRGREKGRSARSRGGAGKAGSGKGR